MKVLVTGGLGFIGSHFIRLLKRERPDWDVLNFDLKTYAASKENVAALGPMTVFGSIWDPLDVGNVLCRGFDAVVNFAAESHVDRSLGSSGVFARTNLEGVSILLDGCRHFNVGRFLQVSTDEVYGALSQEDLPFTEESAIHPNNPYAASKAAADLMVMAYVHSFKLNAVITRSSNNYGPHQYPEKFIPLFVTRMLDGLKCPLYGDGKQIRDWLHVYDNCLGILAALERGAAGEVYNLGGDNERSNINVAKMIAECLGAPEELIQPSADRPGHDRRYAINHMKASMTLGWRPMVTFESGLLETVLWYRTRHKKNLTEVT